MKKELEEALRELCGESHADLAQKILSYEQDIDNELMILLVKGEKEFVYQVVSLRKQLSSIAKEEK